ncbi:MAG: hypothetical protein J0M15_13090 [Deltaproteobacteria bacterium]|nr:hypothetical protein [Deltaproteobacteria bacterium]
MIKIRFTRNILSAGIIFFALISGASNQLNCWNPSTGFALEVKYYGAASNYNKISQVNLSRALATFLRNSSGNSVVPEIFEGDTNWSSNTFSFSAGAAKSFSLNLASDSGGIKLYYVYYATSSLRPPTTFFFNPGECRFN